jgi:hypothetical protein
MVGVVKRPEEIVAEVARACVAVRLKHHDESPRRKPASRRGERCSNLRGVMAVIVDDRNAADFTAE